MRSSSHFQFAKEKPPPPARSLAEFMQRSLAKAGSDCYWPRERSAIDGESMQNRESEAGSSTIHVWAVEIEFKFKFSDRGGSFSFFSPNTEHWGNGVKPRRRRRRLGLGIMILIAGLLAKGPLQTDPICTTLCVAQLWRCRQPGFYGHRQLIDNFLLWVPLWGKSCDRKCWPLGASAVQRAFPTLRKWRHLR